MLTPTIMNLLTEITISYKPPRDEEQITIRSSAKAYEVLLPSFDPDIICLQEEMKVLLLDKANHAIGVFSPHKGGIDATVVDIRIILATALKCAASGLILAHNHPSGNLKVSEQDKQLTKQMKEACTLLNLKVMDHLIITPKGYLSFADEGLL
ncbi:MAG: JAB domain-containing protein [Hydrotalea sp.]|nr:JAB domain-containing protein [Hydrotalea sp.]